MSGVTTCTWCGALYQAGSEELANEPERRCARCRGAWKCGRCGFVGFWSGGPHCGPGSEREQLEADVARHCGRTS